MNNIYHLLDFENFPKTWAPIEIPENLIIFRTTSTNPKKLKIQDGFQI